MRHARGRGPGSVRKLTGTNTFRVAGGKIAESHVNWDALGMMQQLGAVKPLAGRAGA